MGSRGQVVGGERDARAIERPTAPEGREGRALIIAVVAFVVVPTIATAVELPRAAGGWARSALVVALIGTLVTGSLALAYYARSRADGRDLGLEELRRPLSLLAAAVPAAVLAFAVANVRPGPALTLR